jgi:hypothetical protein
MINKKFNRLLVLSKSDIRKDNRISWNCVCDCGNKKTVTGKSLRSGNTKSCGCLQKEKARLSITKFTRENDSPSTKHGMTHTRIYQCWKNIKARCDRKNHIHYKHYGGRGITYDKNWKTFEGFYEDMHNGYTEHLTIDRIDYNGNYTKQNCRWATNREQSLNRRSNNIIEFMGKSMTVQEWSEHLDIPRTRLNNRIRAGYTAKDILSKDMFARHNHKGNVPMHKKS